MNNNIVLIGFMGCGKTTVGQALAEQLSYAFLDTDLYIEEKEGMAICEIFKEKGEGYFRNLETSSLEELVEQTKETIVSSGGGLPLRPENAKLLQKLGFVIYLKVEKETVLERLQGDTTRPLLQCENPAKKVEELLEYRNPIYEVGAHLVVSVDKKSVEEIAEEIVRNYHIMMGKKDETCIQSHMNE